MGDSVTTAPTLIYIAFADSPAGRHIRKWSVEPFEGGEPYCLGLPASKRLRLGCKYGAPRWACDFYCGCQLVRSDDEKPYDAARHADYHAGL